MEGVQAGEPDRQTTSGDGSLTPLRAIACLGALSDPPGGILCPVLSFTPPMLASSGRPTGALDDWVVEPKADGWRAQVAVHGDGYTVWTRTGGDITAKVPELAAFAALGGECVLDGELVTGAGLPTDFYRLAGVLSARRRSQLLTFVAFDLLRLEGRSLLEHDLASRREVLDCLVRVSDGALTAMPMFPGSELEDVLAGCEQLDMEGVVVKRRTSTFRPGRRTAQWRKVKCPGWRTDHAERRIKT